MAIAISPRLNIKINGDSISTSDIIKTWTLDGKDEQIKNLIVGDGEVTLDLESVTNLELIEFYSEDIYQLTFTKVIGGDTPSTNFISLPCQGFFIINPDTTLLDNITALTISTESTTSIVVNINIYGKTSA